MNTNSKDIQNSLFGSSGKERRTKIIATIGPSSESKEMLRQMILSGMNIARLNMSHGTHESHREVIHRIRSLSCELEIPVGILMDLQGPKIRTGMLKDAKPVHLKTGEEVRISVKDAPGDEKEITTNYKDLPKDVNIGDRILLDDGLIELKVIKTVYADTVGYVECFIVNGGILSEHKGINLPGVKVSAKSMTEKDEMDADFGIKEEVDYMALSFVRTQEDVNALQARILEKGSDIPVIAKIEKPEAVGNMEAILDAADGVMVARGDLGVELRPEKVPAIQKKIIKKAVSGNKPVITATQMLESMRLNPVPTRAEASDVANAIFDGTDAIMLSGETASGRFPVETIIMMDRIAKESEASPFLQHNIPYPRDERDPIPHAVAQSAVNILQELDASFIIVFSVSGRTARLVSKQRPDKPVFAFSPHKSVQNRMCLFWGIHPVGIPVIRDAREIIETGERILMEKGYIQKDEIVVIITGLALKSGSTNMIKVHHVGMED